MKKLLALLGLTMLAACTLAPRDLGQAYMFALSPANTAGTAHSGARLIVELPTTAPELDTYRISLIRDKGIRDYYAGARWADFLPVLVQNNVVRTLEGSGLFSAVAVAATGLSGDMTLKVEIRDFQAEYRKGGTGPTIRIRLVASLLNRSDGSVICSFQLQASASRAAGDDLRSINTAFRAAFVVAEKQLVNGLEKGLAAQQTQEK